MNDVIILVSSVFNHKNKNIFRWKFAYICIIIDRKFNIKNIAFLLNNNNGR